MWHGRYLSGFGGASLTGGVGYDPSYQGQHIYELEEQDDTYGSGIFDPEGRAGTANPNMGVFASHDSLPGYLAREVPFTVSRDVTDITDDADVVIVPGGGMSYIESRGKLTGPAVLGPTWRPPQIQPAGWTRHDQEYAFMNKGDSRGTVLNPGAPVRPPPTYRPERTFEGQAVGVPLSPRETGLVPFNHAQVRVPYQSQVQPFVPKAPIHATAHPVARAAPDDPSFESVPLQSTVNVSPTTSIAIPMGGFGGPRRIPPGIQPSPTGASRYRFPTSDPIVPAQYPTHGGVFGADEKAGASPLQLALAGALAGAAVGVVVSVVRKRKKARR